MRREPVDAAKQSAARNLQRVAYVKTADVVDGAAAVCAQKSLHLDAKSRVFK